MCFYCFLKHINPISGLPKVGIRQGSPFTLCIPCVYLEYTLCVPYVFMNIYAIPIVISMYTYLLLKQTVGYYPNIAGTKGEPKLALPILIEIKGLITLNFYG